LAPIEILGFVDQQVGAGLAPARQEDGVRLQQRERPGNEVVEVEPARCGDRLFIGHERPRDRSSVRVPGDILGIHGQVQFQPRDRRVETTSLSRYGLGDEGPENCYAVEKWLDRPARGG